MNIEIEQVGSTRATGVVINGVKPPSLKSEIGRNIREIKEALMIP
jgi:hypothetical protein